MENRIELEKRGKDASEVKELNLDNCHSTSIVGLTSDFKSLEVLSLVKVGLTSLKGFPKLPRLQKLDLSDNRISGALNMLVNCPELEALNLSGNKLDNIETLEPLKELKNLKLLDLYDNPLTVADNYRSKVFSMLPSLTHLDSYDKDEKPLQQSEDENEKYVDGASDVDDEEEIDEEDEEEDLDGEVDEEDEVGLSYLEKENIDEESEGDDYSPRGAYAAEDDEEDEEDEDDEEESPRGKKRKLDDSQD